jgi:hypothetical protein
MEKFRKYVARGPGASGPLVVVVPTGGTTG